MADAGGISLDPARPWCRRDGNSWLLAIRVQPGAPVSQVVGEYGDQLKVRLAAPPVDGKANAELVRFLAQALGVARASVRVERGRASRSKTVRVVPHSGQ